MLVVCIRGLAIIGGVVVYALSRLAEPLYQARPDLLLSEPFLLVPPSALPTSAGAATAVLFVLSLSAMWIRGVSGLTTTKAFELSLQAFAPVTFLLAFAPLLLLGPGALPPIFQWVLLDGDSVVATLVVGAVVYRKWRLVSRLDDSGRFLRIVGSLAGSRALVVAGVLGLVITLLASVPNRRFSQPYDERWGTGDEPRYVRIAASLLHDGDTDIANAEDLIGKRARPLESARRIWGFIPAALRTASEAVRAISPTESLGQAVWKGGPVVEGRKGGTYYVFLPGLPLVLAPSMAIDSFVAPDRLVVTLLTCLALGVLCVLVLTRLIYEVLPDRNAALVVAFALGVTPPLFFYQFQIYTEVTATICVSLMLLSVLRSRFTFGYVLAFGLSGALLPWLHTKYLPLWGVLMAAGAWRGLRETSTERKRWLLFLLGLPTLGLSTLCFYVFHITGSLLPDALWVARGFPREATFLNDDTLRGLYYLAFDRAEGVLVYAPVYACALPGLMALFRRSRFEFGLSVALVLPYLLVSASHDQGGAGGWSPPGRYWVPILPVLAVGIGAWLAGGSMAGRRLRWAFVLVASVCGFWVARGMLVDTHFAYDRAAFLASGILNPSPLLGSVADASEPFVRRGLYPTLLISVLGLTHVLDPGRRMIRQPVLTGWIAVLLVLAGASAASAMWSEPSDWVRTRQSAGATRLRGERVLYVALPDCETKSAASVRGLLLSGTGGSHSGRVKGAAFERAIRVPSTQPVELEVSPEPFLVQRRRERHLVYVVGVSLDEGENPIDVEAVCL